MSLNVYRAGAGEPLVLLHGLGSSWYAWIQVIPWLTERYEVFVPDLPGFGDSPSLPEGVKPTVYNLADAVEEELERSLPETPHLVGNSMGGEIALELARRGRARSVVAFSPSGMSKAAERFYILNSLRLAHQGARVLAPSARLLSRSAAFRSACFWQIRSRPWRMAIEEAAREVENLARPVYRETLEWLEDRYRPRGPGLKKPGEIRCPVLDRVRDFGFPARRPAGPTLRRGYTHGPAKEAA